MADLIKLAINHIPLHPSDCCRSGADHSQVKKSALNNLFKRIHSAPGTNTSQALFTEQEHVLIDQVSLYASYSIFLTPSHIHELAKALAEQKLSVNWAACFGHRHMVIIHFNSFAYQEAARLKAKSLDTRGAFYTLVRLNGP